MLLVSFQVFLKLNNVTAFLTLSGRVFQSFGVANEKALSSINALKLCMILHLMKVMTNKGCS